jgi:hypothetical protein
VTCQNVLRLSRICQTTELYVHFAPPAIDNQRRSMRTLALEERPAGVRASPCVSPTRSPERFFLIRMDENGVAAPSFLVFVWIWAFIHPDSPGHPRPPGSAQGLRIKRKRGKHRENFPRGWWPRLIGDKGQSSSTRCKILPLVSLRRTRSLHAAS